MTELSMCILQYQLPTKHAGRTGDEDPHNGSSPCPIMHTETRQHAPSVTSLQVTLRRTYGTQRSSHVMREGAARSASLLVFPFPLQNVPARHHGSSAEQREACG
jgi:hypothetical protein